MDISPTLGISNQYNPGPMEQYAAIASQGLQQLGAQVQQDITTIQTNQQLKNFSQQLQGINPTAVQKPVTDANGNPVLDRNGNPQMQFDPSFASQMTQAITSNPLAAHSPVGMQAINELGSAHQAAIQGAMLNSRLGNQFGIASLRDQTSANNNANTNSTRLQTNENTVGASIYKTDTGAQTAQSAQQAAGQRQALVLNSRADLQKRQQDFQAGEDDRKALVAQGKMPPQFEEGYEKALAGYASAHAEWEQADQLQKANPTDTAARAKAAGALTYMNNMQDVADVARKNVARYQQLNTRLPVEQLGSGAASPPAQPGASSSSYTIDPDEGAAPAPATQAQPQRAPAQGKPLDPVTARKIYEQAGRDPKKATQLAQQMGFTVQ